MCVRLVLSLRKCPPLLPPFALYTAALMRTMSFDPQIPEHGDLLFIFLRQSCRNAVDFVLKFRLCSSFWRGLAVGFHHFPSDDRKVIQLAFFCTPALPKQTRSQWRGYNFRAGWRKQECVWMTPVRLPIETEVVPTKARVVGFRRNI